MKPILSSVLLSSVLLINAPFISAKDKALLDALNIEADNTSMERDKVLESVVEPSVEAKTVVDYDALERKIAQQIEGLLKGESNNEDNKEKTGEKLENKLEGIVSSALLQGSQLNDIRTAVSTAMREIKKNKEEVGELSSSVIESAGKALKNIVGEEKIGAATSPAQLSAAKADVNLSDDKVATGSTVTVQEGENLYKIAQRVYGSGKKYLALYEANKAILKDPNIIRVGQVLTVP
ncbi:MAG: LysM peptidoglycan-binding domain-containing protein [Cocleimonas sp.]|nr:LysM peptidoglycan-binding domain-containing protein [Cocleimonas sp.]